jgi:hypothetical protein
MAVTTTQNVVYTHASIANQVTVDVQLSSSSVKRVPSVRSDSRRQDEVERCNKKSNNSSEKNDDEFHEVILSMTQNQLTDTNNNQISVQVQNVNNFSMATANVSLDAVRRRDVEVGVAYDLNLVSVDAVDAFGPFTFAEEEEDKEDVDENEREDDDDNVEEEQDVQDHDDDDDDDHDDDDDEEDDEEEYEYENVDNDEKEQSKSQSVLFDKFCHFINTDKDPRGPATFYVIN